MGHLEEMEGRLEQRLTDFEDRITALEGTVTELEEKLKQQGDTEYAETVAALAKAKTTEAPGATKHAKAVRQWLASRPREQDYTEGS